MSTRCAPSLKSQNKVTVTHPVQQNGRGLATLLVLAADGHDVPPNTRGRTQPPLGHELQNLDGQLPIALPARGVNGLLVNESARPLRRTWPH